MRLLVSQNGNQILQVLPDPVEGETIDATGRFVVDLPADVAVDSSSVLTDVITASYAKWAETPFSREGWSGLLPNINHYPLLSNTDIGTSVLRPDFTVDNGANEVLPAPYTGTIAWRGQMGRPSVSPTGNAPVSVAMLEANDTTTPEKPGALVSTQVGSFDATIFTNVMVSWNVYQKDVSHDIRSDYGFFSGTNTPAKKTLTYPDQELSDLVVAVSYNSGTTWAPIARNTVIDLTGIPDPDIDMRLAFLNTGSTKLYLGSFTVLY